MEMLQRIESGNVIDNTVGDVGDNNRGQRVCRGNWRGKPPMIVGKIGESILVRRNSWKSR